MLSAECERWQRCYQYQVSVSSSDSSGVSGQWDNISWSWIQRTLTRSSVMRIIMILTALWVTGKKEYSIDKSFDPILILQDCSHRLSVMISPEIYQELVHLLNLINFTWLPRLWSHSHLSRLVYQWWPRCSQSSPGWQCWSPPSVSALDNRTDPAAASDDKIQLKISNISHLRHLGEDSVRDKHIDCPGPAHPHQLCHRVQEGEAGVRQVVDQQHLEQSLGQVVKNTFTGLIYLHCLQCLTPSCVEARHILLIFNLITLQSLSTQLDRQIRFSFIRW